MHKECGILLRSFCEAGWPAAARRIYEKQVGVALWRQWVLLQYRIAARLASAFVDALATPNANADASPPRRKIQDISVDISFLLGLVRAKS